ncbi:MAG: hypothetical protein EHM65_06960 [Acidobacteriales bacterium]|nr:MAG: hypothetical protein EHM65_06960 [Terriglobales bacterium]
MAGTKRLIDGHFSEGREVLLRLDDLRIGAILQELTLRGATSLKMLTEASRLLLLKEAESCAYRPEPETVGSGKNVVRQQLGTFEDFPAKSRFWVLPNALQETLALDVLQKAKLRRKLEVLGLLINNGGRPRSQDW